MKTRGAEMIRMRMSKTSRSGTDWMFCLASSVMAALMSFQAAPSGVAAAPASAEKVEVRIDNFSFSPSALKVKVGTHIPHTVVSNSPTFKSKVLGTGEKFTFTASKPGTYSYSCSIHPNMTGKVVVE
jgi:plastocyanin